jgi:hypothetical protein
MNKHIDDDDLLTYDEVANIFKLKAKTIMNWKSLGRFHPSEYIKMGESKKAPVRFKKTAILARIKKNIF